MELFEISAAAHRGHPGAGEAGCPGAPAAAPCDGLRAHLRGASPEVDTNGSVSIEKFDDTWAVEAPWLRRLIASVRFGDFESRNWFDQKLRQSGLFRQTGGDGASRTEISSPCMTWSSSTPEITADSFLGLLFLCPLIEFLPHIFTRTQKGMPQMAYPSVFRSWRSHSQQIYGPREGNEQILRC
ncbi:MAG: hypothetical protein ACLRWQ_16510 [Flavonifractor plautii]